MVNCTCKQTSLDLEAELRLADDEDEEVLPPTEEEEKQEDEEEELLEEDEDEVEAEDDDEDEELEAEEDDEEEELELSSQKDLGKLKDMLMAAVKYLDEDGKMAGKPKVPASDVGKALKTLKKYGVNVYSGTKRTPAPKRRVAKKPEQMNWMNFSKTVEEIGREQERADGGMYIWQG